MDLMIADEYGAWLASWSPSKRTVTARRSLARKMLREWGLDGFTSDGIQVWLSGYTGWSRSTYYGHMRDFCAWMVAAGYLETDPMIDVRPPRRPKSVPRPLPESDVVRVIEAARDDERAWVLLALLAGLRAHEIAKIHGRDVTQTHIYVDGKGGIRSAIPTHPDLWLLAQEYPRADYWFPGSDEGHLTANTISRRISILFQSLGLTGSIHRCRHTYGTRLLRAGVNIRVVQQLMRHASLATTEAYTAVSDDEMTAAIGLLTA